MKEKTLVCKSGKTYKLRSIGWSRRNDVLNKVTQPGGKAGLPTLDRMVWANEMVKAIVVEPKLDVVDGELTGPDGVLDVADGDEIWQESLELMGIPSSDAAFLSKLTVPKDIPQV